jgi:hypothetical protein
MPNIKLTDLLAENMRRFKTKNLNEQRKKKVKSKGYIISVWDAREHVLLGKEVRVYDSPHRENKVSANDVIEELKLNNLRMFTKDEIQDYLDKEGTYGVPNARAFVEDPNMSGNPILWDLNNNMEAPRAMPASRVLGIEDLGPDSTRYEL